MELAVVAFATYQSMVIIRMLVDPRFDYARVLKPLVATLFAAIWVVVYQLATEAIWPGGGSASFHIAIYAVAGAGGASLLHRLHAVLFYVADERRQTVNLRGRRSQGY